ncbi:MAG: hypothetical protein HQL82_01825 [Magnetococcales bacterium]|nr:hypothetical protein [Magnetococcales bacterium]
MTDRPRRMSKEEIHHVLARLHQASPVLLREALTALAFQMAVDADADLSPARIGERAIRIIDEILDDPDVNEMAQTVICTPPTGKSMQ